MYRPAITLIAAMAWSTMQSNVAVPRDPYHVATLCTPYPVAAGRRLTVGNGDELQAALDAANAGDVILLARGQTFRPPAALGSFVLRNRSIPRSQWVVVRSASSAFDAAGDMAPGIRASSARADEMAKVRATANNAPAFATEAGASGYRLVGLDIGAESNVSDLANMVDLRPGSSDITIDRCYIHGNDSGNFRRGIILSGARLAVIESDIENFHDANSDSQAVGGSLGPGPFKIVNNLLEAGGENIMFGGADPTVDKLVPADIEIRRNLATKRLAWKAANMAVKNAFELKNARRVLVEGNVFENVWTSGQDGTAIVLKSVNQDGACPWCVTEYVTFRSNIVRNAAHGVVINAAETGRAGVPAPVSANHIRIENVLFDAIGGPGWGGGKLIRIFGGVSDVSITHVTSRSNPNGILDPGGPTDANPRLVFSFNIVERKNYGIGAGGDEGEKTLARNFPSYGYEKNVIVNTSAGSDQAVADGALEARYPPTTWVVGGWDAVGIDTTTSRLTSTSRFRKAAAEGKDIGVDVDAIAAAQQGPSGSAACSSSAVRAGDLSQLPRATQPWPGREWTPLLVFLRGVSIALVAPALLN